MGNERFVNDNGLWSANLMSKPECSPTWQRTFSVNVSSHRLFLCFRLDGQLQEQSEGYFLRNVILNQGSRYYLKLLS